MLVAVFGHLPLDNLKPVHVRQYLVAHPHKIAAAREKALLSAVFNFARNEGLTDAPNPCVGVRGAQSHRTRYVTDSELADAIDRAEPLLADFLELC